MVLPPGLEIVQLPLGAKVRARPFRAAGAPHRCIGASAWTRGDDQRRGPACVFRANAMVTRRGRRRSETGRAEQGIGADLPDSLGHCRAGPAKPCTAYRVRRSEMFSGSRHATRVIARVADHLDALRFAVGPKEVERDAPEGASISRDRNVVNHRGVGHRHRPSPAPRPSRPTQVRARARP